MYTKIKNIFRRFTNPFNLRSRFQPGQKRITWKKVKFWGIRLAIAFVVFIVFLFAWYAKDLPSPGKIKNYQAAASTQLFDRNGKPIYAIYGEFKRTIINSEDIPDAVKEATISAEDRNFYSHHGIAWKGILRALYNDITFKKGYLSGGSTITQQYVKNALLDPKKTITRKIKELILSIEIEVMYSKDEILTMYLNEIPYGSNAYGIEAASQTYFNKPAKELTLAESATLAALPQRPSYFSPYGIHPDERLARVNWVLDSMANQGYITSQEAAQAKEDAKNIKFAEPHQYIVAPHFSLYVKELLIEKYGEQMVEEGGLKVTTSLDLDKQILAEEAVKKSAEGRFDGINASNASLVSIDPKTGQILAMVGSADFFNQDIDGQVNVADALRQPGSSFKPIVYAAAFKKKYNPGFVLWDVQTNFGNYTPRNYSGNFNGPVTMRSALAGSLNIPAVKTLYLAGINNAIDTAHDMGITTLNDRDRYGLSLVLGGGEVKLIDLTTAYGVFANGGNLAPTTAIMKVEDAKGKVLDEYKEDQGVKKALDPQIAYEISSILSDNDARSYAFGSNSSLNFPGRTVAAKTGTTSEYRDAWTVGYTPSLVTGVWVGNNDNTPMSAGAAGAVAAAPIFHQYMQQALANTPNEDFYKPSGITSVTVDKLSNKLPTSNSPETITDIFASWQVPNDYDDIHLKLIIDKFTGKKATDNCPAAYTEEKVFTDLHSEVPDNPNWENPVIAAAEQYGINVSRPPTETSCVGLTEKPTASITSPVNNASVAASFPITVQVQSGAQISKVDFYVDNKKVGTDTSSPFSFKTPELTMGKHAVSIVATNIANQSTTDKISVYVNSDSNPPGEVTIKSINPVASGLNVYWVNPSDSDLLAIRIYASDTQGSLGTVIKSLNVSPSSNASAALTGLQSGKTYWLTFRTVDKSGNENQNNKQSSATPL